MLLPLGILLELLGGATSTSTHPWLVRREGASAFRYLVHVGTSLDQPILLVGVGHSILLVIVRHVQFHVFVLLTSSTTWIGEHSLAVINWLQGHP